MHKRYFPLIPFRNVFGSVVVGIALILFSTGSSAGSVGKAKSGIKQITTSEYEALKREISILHKQVEMLMKRAGPPPNEQAKNATSTKSDHASTAQVLVPSSSPEAPRQGAAAASRTPERTTPSVPNDLAEGDRKQEAEEAKRQLDTFLRSQKLLFKKGQLQAELGLSYTNDVQINNCTQLGPLRCVQAKDTRRVQLVPRISTRSADLNLIARYGVMDNLEFDLFVPLSYLERESSDYIYYGQGEGFRDGVVRRAESVGLGDISASLRYALRREDGSWPDITLALDAKSATGSVNRNLGTGFWNLGVNVTLVKTIDPVVLFGSVGYVAALEAGGIDPGDQIPYTVGMGYSLNDRVSYRISLSGAVVRHTENVQGLAPATGFDLNVLQFSTTIQNQKDLYFEPFVGLGLTEESPDFIAGLRIPYRFPGYYPLPFIN